MSKLSVGIVGLPNVGKSTLFNALLKKQAAYAANFPFATIDPNIGVVPVPDIRLSKLAEIVKKSDDLEKLPPEVPATIEFVDIAGLIKGAHKGEGLGNKFLAHIREVSAILHVVRDFKSPEIIREGAVDPKSDLETIETELILADLQTLEKIGNRLKKEGNKHSVSAHLMLKKSLSGGTPARAVQLTKEEKIESRDFFLLTAKPILIVLNIDESDLKNAAAIEKEFAGKVGVNEDQVIALCAKLEEDLASLTDDEQRDYLKEHGIDSTGLQRVIKKAFSSLGLITFLTAGEKEVRAWTIKNNMTAPEAAGTIHTDFETKFIKAEVIKYEDYIEFGGEKNSKEHGKLRVEGKEYLVQDGDVIEFKVGA